MFSIGDLLKNHKIPGTELSEMRAVTAAVASALVKYKIAPKNVKFKNGTVFFSIPSVLKTELMLREADLKRMLKDQGISIESIK